MALGKVYLVGAGPGDPGLITLRAAEVLARADSVLYDYLANPVVLRHCRPGTRLISLGKHGRERIVSQAEIHEQLVSRARQGETVVRLKSGDPMVFGRGGEEIEWLVEHAIPFEIVPGITAATAAASYAGLPITHRDAASAVALVTGHRAEDGAAGEGGSPGDLDYAALAHFPGTLVFYMGVTTVAEWSAALLGGGLSAATPVAVLRRVSFPDQLRLETTLGEVAAVVSKEKLRPPVVFVVGEAARARPEWSWFERRPLLGRRILVTRPRQQADDLARPLAELGADVLVQPAIEIAPPADWRPVDAALARLHEFDWLVFSSANGVRSFLDRLLSPPGQAAVSPGDVRALGGRKLAAIGPGTAEELARYCLRADLVPEEFRAESLAVALRNQAAGRRFLLLRASRGREVLAEELARAGGQVEQIVVYESRDTPAPDAAIAAQLAAGQIHWTTVTSSAIARSLVRLLGEALRRTKLASISPITSATLRELGHEPAAEAREYTMVGVVEAIVEAEK